MVNLGNIEQTVGNSLRDGNARPPYLLPENPVCRSRSNRTGHGTTDWFQIGKEVHQGCIYCHPTYLTSMQSTSCKMPGWMKHKLEKESEKGGLKLSIQKTNIMAPGLISSVQFSRSVVSDFLQPHESQHTRPPCPSPTPRVHSDSHPSSQ